MWEKLMCRINQLKNNTVHVLGSRSLPNYSVLLPLIVNNNKDIHIMFEKRAPHLRRQPGEICFPGGQIEKGVENSQTAAIRETCEELQLHQNDIELIGPLDFLVSPYEAIIYPYVGWIHKHMDEITPNPTEVAEIFTVPLIHIMKQKPKVYQVNLEVKPKEDFPFHLIPNGKEYNWRVRSMKEYFYFYEKYIIWGLTANILHEFLENLK